MNEFRGVVCWDPSSLQRVVPLTAESPSDAVFQATHVPARLERTLSGTSDRRIIFTEEELLQEFLSSERTFTFVPIVGASGSGKSHLVRWLASRIPSTVDRHVVVIKKYQTNLRSVVEAILSGLRGHNYDEFRERLAATSGSLVPSEARHTLLSALVYQVGMDNAENSQGNLAESEGYIAAKLPYFLGDPFIAKHLAAEGGIVDRFVRESLQGRGFDDRDSPYEFVISDLVRNFDDIAQVNDAGKLFFQALHGRPVLQRQTVAWMNKHLASALRRVYGLRANELRALVFDLRQRLLAEGKELVLLVEDFAVLQGIQGELLDALLEDTEQAGTQVLCTIRAALAVTTGYFKGLDTASTRATFVVDLDVAVVDAEPTGGPIRDLFIGRYLNAVRVGEQSLSRAWEAADDKRGTTWTPNRCAGCVHRVQCHEAFGASEDGHGLYPFNQAAIANLGAYVEGPSFNPRRLLRDVLVRVLRLAPDSLSSGTFPPDILAESFDCSRLDLDDLDRLEDLEPSQAERARRVRLLSVWSPQPALRNLASGLHEAFSLPPLELDGMRPGRPGVPPPPTETPDAPQPSARGTRPSDASSGSVAKGLVYDKIARGESLSMSEAQELRSLVFRAVNEWIDWESLGLTQRYLDSESIWTTNGVWIHGDPSRRPTSPMAVKLEIGYDAAERTDAAVVLRNLGRAQSSDRWPSSEMERVARLLESWAGGVVSQVSDLIRGKDESSPLSAIVEALVIGASVAGRAAPHSAPLSSRLAGILAPLPEPTASKESRLGPLATTFRSHHRRLVVALLANASLSKGDGKPRMLDLVRIEPALEAAYLQVSPMCSLPDGMRTLDAVRSVRPSQALIPEALASERQRIDDLRAFALGFFGHELRVERVADALQKAASAAFGAGVFRPHDWLAKVQTGIDHLRQGDVVGLLGDLDRRLSSSGAEQLRGLAALNESAIQEMVSTVRMLDEFLHESTNQAEVVAGMFSGEDHQIMRQVLGTLIDIEEALR